jgi:hypothetical protein
LWFLLVAAGRRHAAVYHSHDGPFDVYFEHGHWWLFDIGRDRTFSVCDAEADTVAREQELGVSDGFVFEEV